MIARLVSGKTLSARIHGSYGVYHTSLEIGSRGKLLSDCTCPAEMLFCKHAVALGLTWLAEPETFFDLGSLEDHLKEKSREELFTLICKMAERYPEVLSVLGIEGFEESEEEDGYEW